MSTAFFGFLLSIISVTSSTTSSPINTPTPYSVKGTIPGMADGTKLYLKLTNPISISLDSVEVKDGRFELSGKFDYPGNKAILQTAKLTDYVIFWLEDVPVELTGNNGKLRGATIHGGPMQSANSEFSAWIAPLRKAASAIEEQLRNTKGEERKKWIDSSELNREQELQLTRDFIRQKNNSFYSAYLLNLYSTTWGKDTVQELFSKLTRDSKTSSFGKEIDRYLSLSKALKMGDAIVDFKQPTPDGKLVALSSYKNKVVLLEFWASWCGPCRAENPTLLKTYQAFKQKGFEIHAVSLDDNKQAWKDAIISDKLTWPQVSDLKGDRNEAALIYNISGIPDNILIDKNGKIIARNLRGQALSDKLSEILR